MLPAVTHSSSSLESFGGTFGSIVSAVFLFLIGALNLVILAGILKVFRSMRHGDYDEAELERQLENRGFFYRFFGKWMKAIDKEWQMYPVGVVFGMGFDTATEVALLTATALAASEHIPWQAIICLPILFTAGMSLMDTTDGMFMKPQKPPLWLKSCGKSCGMRLRVSMPPNCSSVELSCETAP